MANMDTENFHDIEMEVRDGDAIDLASIGYAINKRIFELLTLLADLQA